MLLPHHHPDAAKIVPSSRAISDTKRLEHFGSIYTLWYPPSYNISYNMVKLIYK